MSLFSSGVVSITTQDGATVFASVFILSARSSVFKAMFKSGMREEKEMKLLLDDVPEALLKLFLHALHSDELPASVNVEDGIVLAALAERYDVPYVKAFVINRACAQISNKNVGAALRAALTHKVSAVVEHAVRFSGKREVDVKALADGLCGR